VRMLTMANLKVSPVDSGKPSIPGPSYRPHPGTVPSMPARPDSAAILRPARRRSAPQGRRTHPTGPGTTTLRVRPARRLAALALAVGLGTVTAACGGAKEPVVPGPESPTPVLSRVEFTARANEICRATTEAIVKRNDDLSPSNLGGGNDATKARQEIEKLARTAIAHLRNLTPPPEDAPTAQKAWNTMEGAVDNASRDATLPLDPVGLVQPELFSYGLSGCFANG
jgi:hypothetical protein